MKKLILVATNQKGDTHSFTTADIEQNFRKDVALLMPMYDNTPYLKGAVEATTNSLWQLTTALKPNKSTVPYEELHTGKTDEGIHEDFMIVMKDTTNLLQKMVHSHSYREGTFESFDAAEYVRQLEYITARCKKQLNPLKRK